MSKIRDKFREIKEYVKSRDQFNSLIDQKVASDALEDSNEVVSTVLVDHEKRIQDTTEQLNTKQDKLVPGENITIVDNVISSTGGGGSDYTAGENIRIVDDKISAYGYSLQPGFVEIPGIQCYIRKMTQAETDELLGLGYAYYNYVEVYDNMPDESTGLLIVGDCSYDVLYSEYIEESSLADCDVFYVENDIEGVDENDVYECTYITGTSTASGSRSHAEGESTTASGSRSHAEGLNTAASGAASHAEGESTTASGSRSHAEGIATQATNEAEHAQGKYNKSNSIEIPQPIEYVDLGLPSGLLWAKWNLGATSETEYGDYYAWGEIEPKSSYTWENYKWGNPNAGGLTKYNANDGKTELDPEDDAAHVNLGSGWRMPTKDEIQELIDNTDTSLDSDSGFCILTSRRNQAKLYIPCTGCFGNSNYISFWINSVDYDEFPNYINLGLGLYINGETKYLNTDYRYEGVPVRPVISPEDAPQQEYINTIHSIGIGTSDNNRGNAFEIMDNGDVYVKGIGGYDGTNPGNSQTLQEVIQYVLNNLPQTN